MKKGEDIEHYELKMPKMGESISQGTIIDWLIGEGEAFEEGDILLEVATDKVDNEIPAPVSGTIVKILTQAKAVVPVGDTMAILEVGKQVRPAAEKTVRVEDKTSKKETVQDKNRPKILSMPPAEHVPNAGSDRFFSPLVVSIAKEHHISFEELARIPATGQDGRLRKSDVFNYIDQGRPYQFTQTVLPDPTAYRIPQLHFDKGKGKIIAMDRMRQLIADHMVYSKHTSPHVTTYAEADMTLMVRWRNTNKDAFYKAYGQRLTFTPLFIEAIAKAISDFPNINASVDGHNIIIKDEINIGMATALPSGNLIVPVVKQADTKDLKTLAKTVNELADKARQNQLNADDIKGSTFTISNVGTFGSLMGTPIINQPEVAILALGLIKKRPEVMETDKGDEIVVRSMMYLSLSFDHRVVDGYLAGSFLRRVADYFEQFDEHRRI